MRVTELRIFEVPGTQTIYKYSYKKPMKVSAAYEKLAGMRRGFLCFMSGIVYTLFIQLKSSNLYFRVKRCHFK